MGVSSDFQDIVRTCEFYRESEWSFYVDYVNLHVAMGGYGIDLVREDGHLVGYLVEDPYGATQLVDDLDSYFKSALDCGV